MSKESRSSFDLISHNIKTCAGLINGTENNFLPFKRLTSQTSEGVLWYQTLRSYMLLVLEVAKASLWIVFTPHLIDVLAKTT